MGNLCGVPSVNEPQQGQQQGGGVEGGGNYGAGAQGTALGQRFFNDNTNTAASVGTQQSRTPQNPASPFEDAQHANGQQAQHPSVSSSTTTTTTTRETRENERGDGLMPLNPPPLHEAYPTPRHHLSSNTVDHDGWVKILVLVYVCAYACAHMHTTRTHTHARTYTRRSPPQTIPLNWTKGKLIGAGAFGRVFQGLDDDTGQIVAVKQVRLTFGLLLCQSFGLNTRLLLLGTKMDFDFLLRS